MKDGGMKSRSEPVDCRLFELLGWRTLAVWRLAEDATSDEILVWFIPKVVAESAC